MSFLIRRPTRQVQTAVGNSSRHAGRICVFHGQGLPDSMAVRPGFLPRFLTITLPPTMSVRHCNSLYAQDFDSAERTRVVMARPLGTPFVLGSHGTPADLAPLPSSPPL